MLAVDRERLAREASEHHTTALAETKRLVEEAEQRATSAEERAREAVAQATEARAQAQTEAESILTRARREAEQIIAAANTQAESITASGDSEKQRQLAALKAEVDRLAKRRDAITAQLASLRDVVAGFGDDDGGRLSVRAPDRVREHGRGPAARSGPRTTTRTETDGRSGAVGGPSDLGEPGPPLDHRAPFFVGFVGATGALLAYWLLTNIAADRLDAGADRRGAVPRRGAQPGGDVLRAARAAPGLRGPRGDRLRASSPWCCSSWPSCR